MPFYPTNNPKNQNFSKMKKTHGDIITLHMRTKTHGHMLYCSWGMGHDECNCCFSFWIYFCAFTPITAKKNIFFKWRNLLQISSFYTCVPKIMIRWCKVPEIWRMTDGKTNRQMDRQTQKKWNIEVGALPKNKDIFSS